MKFASLVYSLFMSEEQDVGFGVGGDVIVVTSRPKPKPKSVSFIFCACATNQITQCGYRRVILTQICQCTLH